MKPLQAVSSGTRVICEKGKILVVEKELDTYEYICVYVWTIRYVSYMYVVDVWTTTIAGEDANICNIFRDPQDLHTCAPLRSQNFIMQRCQSEKKIREYRKSN